jgi:hypothetical protein
MSIASSIELTKQRMAANGGEPIQPAIEAPKTPIAAGFPPQDLPIAAPSRGSMPTGLASDADINIGNRSSTKQRSAVYIPATPVIPGSDTVAKIQATIQAEQGKIISKATTAAQATVTAAVSGVSQNASNAVATANSASASAATSAAALATPALSAIAASGNVNTQLPYVVAQGGCFPSSIVGTTSSILSYTANASTHTVVISWSSFNVLFADQTVGTIPSGNQTITGISTGTYYVYLYLDITNTVQLALGDGTGQGTPAVLFQPQNPTAAQQMNGQSATAMSTSGVQIIMPASGGGTGGGGGSGLCVRDNTIVLHREKGEVKLLDCSVGDFIKGRTDWTEIVAKRVIPFGKFVRITGNKGESVQITPTHRTTVVRGGVESSMAALDVAMSDFLIVADGFDTIRSIEFVEEDARKITITAEPEHEYFAGENHPTTLVHNAVPVS